MKKVPTKAVIEQRNSIVNSLNIDDHRDSPSQEVLDKRLIKRRHRQKTLRGLENKYDFTNGNNRKQDNGYNLSNKTNEQLIKKFKDLLKYKNLLDNYDETPKANKVPLFKSEIQEIYHTIETEKMNGHDMYNMINALQYQLRTHREEKIERKKENIKKSFDSLGGIQLYLKLKSYLTDIGVDIHELY